MRLLVVDLYKDGYISFYTAVQLLTGMEFSESQIIELIGPSKEELDTV